MTTLREQVADAVAAARALPGTKPARTSDVDRRVADAVIPIILGRAAEVARDRHEQWRMPHPDDAKPGEVCDDISACRDIAAAIRRIGSGE